MAHSQQSDFVRRICNRFSDLQAGAKILEIGSQDINGSVRDCFSGFSEYVGIDLNDARAVDLVVPGELLELPSSWATIIVSTECLEHSEGWADILQNMIRLLAPGGLLLLTFAGIGRPAHGTVDSESRSSPHTLDYYRNLSPYQLLDAVQWGHFFSEYSFEVNSSPGDTYFWGFRSDAPWASQNGIDILEQRLSRAQGQLAQAVERLAQADHQAQALKFQNQSYADVLVHQEVSLQSLADALMEMRRDWSCALESAEMASLREQQAQLALERLNVQNQMLRTLLSDYEEQCQRAIRLLYRAIPLT